MNIVALDIGSVATKAILWRDGEVKARGLVPTAWQPRQAAEEVLGQLLDKNKPFRLAATGYGRDSAKEAVELAESWPVVGEVRLLNEITSLGRGLNAVLPEVRLALDVGGQDSKALALDDRGRVLDFVLNDKCAAGAGVFVDSIRQSYNLTNEEFGALAAIGHPVPLSSMCAVFAQTELVAQIAKGVNRADLAAGVLASLAARLKTQCGRLFNQAPMALTGGLSRMPVFADFLQASLGVTVLIPPDAPFLAALGAALIIDEDKQPG